MKYKRLGEMLVDVGAITEAQLEEALAGQKGSGKRLGTYLVDEKYISEDQLIEILRRQLGIDFIDLNKAKIDPSLVTLVPKNIAKSNRVVPVRLDRDTLYLAMEDPMNFPAVEQVKNITKKRVIPMIAYSRSIDRALSVLYDNEGAAKAMEEMKEEQGFATVDETANVLDSDDTNAAPTVKLVNSIIERGIIEKASDIHIEPREHDMCVRIRVDGRLNEVLQIPKELQSAVISRFKVMANMNIAERRIPQDGRAIARRPDGTNIDLRLNSLPTIYGEKIVIRLLTRETSILNPHGIGITDEDIPKFDRLMKNTSGVVLIVGPTGSGKTSTLYTMINALKSDTVNMISLEDPVEFQIEGVTQVAINEKVGLTFASALRACLRQDPDIICIGEIRDGETAEIAMRAAMTGHFVLSTIHTEDACSAIDRLKDMGVEPYLVAGSVRGVISQRLVRKICPNCREETTPDPLLLDYAGIKNDGTKRFYHGRGCHQCFDSGYRGRTGVFEIMTMNSKLRDIVASGATGTELRRQISTTDFTPMIVNGRKLIDAGVTTVDEVVRTIVTLE
ncbi:MAG: Flp pilus assembly complex ATPase component TadA [Solobacterium sp.]|nr:Flp pilus assembly complex ATPase component TadA [Solobacterium sp.]